MYNHEPSDMIPLYNGMVISFINYEIRVNMKKKDDKEIESEQEKIVNMTEQFYKTDSFSAFFKAQAYQEIQSEQDPEEGYTARATDIKAVDVLVAEGD